jgi:AcrR family transcriptional regulator
MDALKGVNYQSVAWTWALGMSFALASKPPSQHRQRDPVATRARILEAANTRFSRDSYERVGLRQIAKDAGVDAALVTRYFGSKEGLFQEVLSRALYPAWLLDLAPETWGERLFASFDEDIDARGGELDFFMLLFHASTMPDARPALRELIQERLMRPLSAWIGGEDALLRAKLIATLLTGVSVQLVTAGRSPLDEADWARFRRAMAMAVQTLASGAALVSVPLQPAERPAETQAPSSSVARAS